MKRREKPGEGDEKARQGKDHRLLKRIEALLETGFEVIKTGVEMGPLRIDALFNPVEPLVDLFEPPVDLRCEMVETVVIPVGFCLLHPRGC